jgi:hypothetical protein
MPHDDHRFDKRILQRNLLSGVVTQKEYEGYLEQRSRQIRSRADPPQEKDPHARF